MTRELGQPLEWEGVETITAKRENPKWYPTEDIQWEMGVPTVIYPGPQNPLGPRAFYLGDTLYRITAPIDLARLESAQWRTWGTRIRAGVLGSERTLRNDVQQCRDEDGEEIASALTMQSLLRRKTGRLASG